MPDVVIRAEGLGKSYLIGHQAQRESYTALRDVIARGAQKWLRKAQDMAHGRPIIAGDSLEEVWALRDVSFDVTRGEVVGIIGRNGAGKSTLLKILSRITEPSEGRVSVTGRVASLLEVGTGFHPELTGRANIYLNGAILGMSHNEIKNKFDEIVAFAEIEKFLDTPVKRYSSGMYVRLAFAVAAHLEPEILIVDEVLAVGDVQFQRKCLGKMGEVAGREGRTVLFVSHQMTAVAGLCPRAILLNQSRVVTDGPTGQVVDLYLRESVAEIEIVGRPRLFTGVGNDRVQLLSAMIAQSTDRSRSYVLTSDDLELSIQFENRTHGGNIDLTLDLFNEYGVHVCHFGTLCSTDGKLAYGVHRCTGVFPGGILNSGRYSVHVHFGLDQKYVLLRHENALTFTLEDGMGTRTGNFSRLPGVVHPVTSWVTRQIGTSTTAVG